MHESTEPLPRIFDPSLRKMRVPEDEEPPYSPGDPDGEQVDDPEPDADPRETAPEDEPPAASDEPSSDAPVQSVHDLPVANLEWIDQEAPASERRQQERTPIDAGVRVTINGREFLARGVDISRGGLSFQPVPYWAKKGDPVLIEIGEPPEKIIARVAWRRPLDDGSDNLIIGVRFSKPLDEEPSVDLVRPSS